MTAAKVAVQYALADDDSLPSAAEITRWVRETERTIRPRPKVSFRAPRLAAAEVLVRIVGEQEMSELNQRYRNKAGPTNVLSFGYDAHPGFAVPFLGDIVLCAPVALQEAASEGKAREAHFAHLVVHGSLHLLGFDHEEAAAAHTMESLETKILAQLGYPDPYLTQPV